MKGVGLSSRDIWTLAIVVVGVVVMWTSRRLSKEEDKDVPKAEERICSQRTNPERRRRRRIFSNSTNASLGFLPFVGRRRRRRRREWCCACKTRAESRSKVPTNASFKERAMCCACVCATKSKVEENFENCFFFSFFE
mgnify:FL=1